MLIVIVSNRYNQGSHKDEVNLMKQLIMDVICFFGEQ